MCPLIDAAEIKGEGQDEEDDRRVDGRLAQDIARIGAERRLCRTAAEGRAHAPVLRLLGQDDQNDEQRDEDEEDRENSEAGLRRATGFLRTALGKRLRIHNIPELRFVYDTSIERGVHLSLLIDRAVADDPSREK